MEGKQFHLRTLAVAGLLALLLLVFAGALYQLQIIKVDEYRAASTVKIANTGTVEAARGEIVDRYGEPPKGVLNLVEIALLRTNAKKVGITDIRQKAGDVLFTLSRLDFEAVSALCAQPDYKNRVQFVATAKEPTLRLKLSTGVDSLRQSKVFLEHFRDCCQM